MSNTTTPVLFANTILVPRQEGQVPRLQTVGPVDRPRKKRPHFKSRRGCTACKRRRVKCDERLPCSSCIKRNTQCVQPLHPHVAGSDLLMSSPHAGIDMHPPISLLHLELFHHWDKETRPTLTFPQIWPVVVQRAFHEDFIMSAILCVSAMHLATLCPQNTKYSRASTQLMAKTVQLFGNSLQLPFTKESCEALVGTALLVNYISWLDLGFLDCKRAESSQLNLAEDQLFFLSPGIVQVWFQAMPILIDSGSIFTQITSQNPRLSIEEALIQRGQDPARFVPPFMRIWDDARYQNWGCTQTETPAHGPTSYAWRLLLGLENELSCFRRLPRTTVSKSSGKNEKQVLAHLRDVVSKVNTIYTSAGHPDAPNMPPQSARSSFEFVVRRISPLLCCVSSDSASNEPMLPDIGLLEGDIEQLVYGFPILCCGPFAELITDGDPRALVLLYHLYRTARIALSPGRCWWAHARSSVMEKLIFQELKSKELDVWLST